MINTELFSFLNLLTPLATVLNASTSNPESVSSKTANFGFIVRSWRISLFFFSPPENPSFIDLFKKESSSPSSYNMALALFKNSSASISSLPWCFLWAFNADLKK